MSSSATNTEERIDPTIPINTGYPATVMTEEGLTPVRIMTKLAGGVYVDEDDNQYERSSSALVLKPLGAGETTDATDDANDANDAEEGETKAKNGRRKTADND